MTSHEPYAYPPRATHVPLSHPLRHFLAASLALTSGFLAALARRVDAPTLSSPAPSYLALEFYADASAPEGALYVDGELIGYLEGVTRL